MTRTEFGAGLLTCVEMAPHQNTAYCAPHEKVQVVFDPRFGRGLPVIAANRVPVRTLLDLSAAGESAEAIAYEYDMEPGQVAALCQGVMSAAKRLPTRYDNMSPTARPRCWTSCSPPFRGPTPSPTPT
ncbi:DUF433 domain-containing protein [Actinacidiphila acididurans]|uniref:DUF433 domain-containing protein n=1 Tax=Actinacidiphila acididurans TaxID=2784346 RepID=A0ABS2U009_9ACTN|nr:DUF433 domain-containing protein [Actinacidiphila acididurans]MBM9508939.1 DUF433 domain-containing protein [Actinacidiphila acididurans]